SPEDGVTLDTRNVTVSVEVANFTLVEPTGQANAPGEGHLIYLLDAPVSTNETVPAIPEVGDYVISTNTSQTWENLIEAAHTFSVQVDNNDDTPVVPLAADTVNVTVSLAAPPEEEEVPPAEANVTSVIITSPEDGATLDTRSVSVSVEVANFTLVASTGQVNAPAEGHLIYCLDAPVSPHELPPGCPVDVDYVISTNTS